MIDLVQEAQVFRLPSRLIILGEPRISSRISKAPFSVMQELLSFSSVGVPLPVAERTVSKDSLSMFVINDRGSSIHQQCPWTALGALVGQSPVFLLVLSTLLKKQQSPIYRNFKTPRKK